MFKAFHAGPFVWLGYCWFVELQAVAFKITHVDPAHSSHPIFHAGQQPSFKVIAPEVFAVIAVCINNLTIECFLLFSCLSALAVAWKSDTVPIGQGFSGFVISDREITIATGAHVYLLLFWTPCGIP